MPYFEEIKTLGDIARYHARERGEHAAFVCGERSTSYAEFDVVTNQVANALLAEALPSQSRIAVLDKNSDWFFELLVGGAKADMPVVGINWRLAPLEVAFIINNAESEILFLGEEFLPLIDEVREQLSALKKVILMKETSDGLPDDVGSYVDWRNAASKKDPEIEVKQDSTCIQMYTSGTTGKPKGVMVSHWNILSTYKIVNDLPEPEEDWSIWSNEDVSLIVMPNFHIGGSGWGLMGLYAGAKNVVLPEYEPSAVLDCFNAHKISKIFLVPAAMQFLLQHPKCKTADFSSMRYMIYGASPIPLPLLQQAMEVFKCEFVQLYGMTETTALGAYLPPEDHEVEGNQRMKGAGKARPGVEICIKNPDGKDVTIGDVGEICIKTESNMLGYWKKPEATKETFVDDWLKTGDAGYMDEDGYVYVHDRIKDMIVSGGENIYPAEIESAMFGHDAIADIAVIGVPDDKWGEAVKAVVVLKPDAQASAQELIEFTQSKIAGFKVPKTVDFVDLLPRNPSGKLLKRELREPYWQGKDRRVN